MNIKLSFIIPVFNVEQYIEKCILSIENQDISHSEYEIIVVNDGTMDNSVSIIKCLQQKYGNIKLYNKENGGLSSARNFGLKYATGDYIWFIDSDDFIDSNVLKSIIDKAYSENLDVLCFGNKDVYSNGNVLYPYTRKPLNIIVSGIDFLQHYELSIAAWSCIMKRKLFTQYNIQFTEGIYHEDYEFILYLYEYCDRITYMDIYPYNYIIKSQGTITTSKNSQHTKRRIDSWITIIKNISQKYSTQTDPSLYGYYANKWCNTYKFHALSALLMLPLSFKEKKYYIHKFKEVGCFPIGEYCGLNRRRKMITHIYNHPFLYTYTIFIWNRINSFASVIKKC